MFGTLLVATCVDFVTLCVCVVPFRFYCLYSCQESTFPKETSMPSGMQWPGSSLPSPEALPARNACVDAMLLMHVIIDKILMHWISLDHVGAC